jgi:menaquinol-cytochrome c reductase cytochrome b/c subunit
MSAIVLGHIALVIWHGVSVPPSLWNAERDAAQRLRERESADAYDPEAARYATFKREGRPFWPDVIFEDLIVATIVFLALLALTLALGIPLESRADPSDTSYIPRPEWYFLFLFQLLRYFPGQLEWVGVVVLPLLAFAALLLLPLLDRGPERRLSRRPVATTVATLLAAGIGFLTTSAFLTTPTGAVQERGQTLTAAQLLGRTTYRQYCADCHGANGEGSAQAPSLQGIAQRRDANFVHNYIEDPQRIGRGALMPAFSNQLSHQQVEEVTQYVLTFPGGCPVKALGDYLGPAVVLLALVVGVGIAVLANGLSFAPSASPEPAAGAPTSAPADESALTGGNRDRGRETFRALCQGCHTQGRQSFAPEARERLALLQSRIRQGAGEMPAFPPDLLADVALKDVLAYISTPAEPEPPPTPEPRVRGVNLEFLGATGIPGAAPTVRFRVRDDAGAVISPADMQTLAITVGGPTTDYRWAQREDARRAQASVDRAYEYTFTARLPEEAGGTYAVGIEGAFDHPAGVVGPQPYREVAFNPVSYFVVSGAGPVAHRTVVRIESCNECHGTLATHGGTRRNTDLCVICHNETQTDEDKRTTFGGPMPPEPVLFRNLIHRIHTGEDLTHPFVVIGGNPASPLRSIWGRCIRSRRTERIALCHEPGTFNITSTLEALSPMTVTQQGQTVRTVPPVTAACTGCHDSDRTLAHAAAQTTSQGVETCAVCHGPGRPASVSAVHRIAAAR